MTFAQKPLLLLDRNGIWRDILYSNVAVPWEVKFVPQKAENSLSALHYG